MTDHVNPNDRNWRLVETWALQRLHDYRRALENPACTEIQTALLRGKCAELSALIKLGQPVPEPTPEEYPDD